MDDFVGKDEIYVLVLLNILQQHTDISDNFHCHRVALILYEDLIQNVQEVLFTEKPFA